MMMILLLLLLLLPLLAFKGAIRDFFYNLLTVTRTVSNTYAQVALGAIVYKSRATHRALITCNMSFYVPLGTKGQLS